jgi:ATP/maltotriose-dependent transcriptional regulator MalT
MRALAARALAQCDLAIDLLSGPRDFAERAEALFFKGAKLQELGRWEEALEVHRMGVALCRDAGYARGLAAHLGNLGAVLSALGRQDEAREAVDQSLSLREEAGDPAGVAFCLNGLADIALAEGRWDEARSRSARALSLNRKIGYVMGRRVALMNLAKAEFGEGDLAMAERWLRDCLESLADDPTVTSQIAQAHSLLAALYDKRGDSALADEHRTAAEDAYRLLGLDLAVIG